MDSLTYAKHFLVVHAKILSSALSVRWSPNAIQVRNGGGYVVPPTNAAVLEALCNCVSTTGGCSDDTDGVFATVGVDCPTALAQVGGNCDFNVRCSEITRDESWPSSWSLLCARFCASLCASALRVKLNCFARFVLLPVVGAVRGTSATLPTRWHHREGNLSRHLWRL